MKTEIRVGSFTRGPADASTEYESVTITENSTTFQDLLTFIYPDKPPTSFAALTSLMRVLDAAAKYDMKGVVESLSAQLTKGMMEGALMYQNPLWVYVKAKQLDLADLTKAAANATLTTDLGGTPNTPEVANAPASWILELVTLRATHSKWWSDQCQTAIRIASMGSDYNSARFTSQSVYRRSDCQCPRLSTEDTIQPPTRLVLKILERPCAKSVREIDFNLIIGCLRCGAAARAHYSKICQNYESQFGVF